MEKQIKDEEYVRRIQEGDMQALESLLQRYHKLAYYIALKFCHSHADADEIVQNSFIEVHKSIHTLKEPKYFKAWFNRILFSKSTKLFREHKDVVVDENASIQMKTNPESKRERLPQDTMHFQSDQEVLLHFIDALPEKMKTVLIMMYFEEMSIAEIAYALQIPQGTVKSRLNSAKTILKEQIQHYEKAEGIRLNFHMRPLGSLIGIALWKEMHQYFPAAKKVRTNPYKQAKWLLSTSVGVVMLCGILYAVHGYSDPTQATTYPQTIKKEFPGVYFQGIHYTTARDAYAAIVTFAHCEEELKQVNETERAEVKEVYQTLKEYGGTYYELLSNRQYAEDFE